MEIKIQNIEEEINNLKKIIKDNEKFSNETFSNKNESCDCIEIKSDNQNENLLKYINPENQTIYCQCCNFTNSNHNAVRLILEMVLIVINLSSVCGLCYIIFIK